MSIEAFLDYLHESPATAELAESLTEVLEIRGLRPVTLEVAPDAAIPIAG